MGQSDYYLAALKGAVLSRCLDIQLVDIATSISFYNLKQASYVLSNAYPYFPVGTIHLMNVNAVGGKMLCVQHEGHYFILFDNGSVPLIFGSVPAETYLINADVSVSSNLLFIEGFTNVINAITSGLGIAKIGTLTQQVVQLRWMIPNSNPGLIRGTIQYIDHYGNAITNITKEIYEQNIGDRAVRIQFGTYTITEIKNRYSNVKESDELCFFNAEGNLEIALNKFPAGNMLSLTTDKTVVIIEAN